MPAQGGLSVERMCQLAQVSRAGFYRSLREQAPQQEETELRGRIQEIVVENRRRYGIRRVAAQLRAEGRVVNRKRVARIMREDNLLAVRQRRFVVTTDSEHEHTVYFNLAGRMQLTGINQLWVADITYIRLQGEFVYVAVILDAYSRKVIGWELDRSLQTRLTVAALLKAIEQRDPPPGIVHHSDRGVQYASPDYLEVLHAHGMVPSMSRAGCPYDNAACESFMKTLKQEEIYATEYQDLENLREHLEEFLEQYYNCHRLHSALKYQTPASFEANLAALTAESRAAKIEFSEA